MLLLETAFTVLIALGMFYSELDRPVVPIDEKSAHQMLDQPPLPSETQVPTEIANFESGLAIPCRCGNFDQ